MHYLNFLLNVIITGGPSSPSAPLSPWNKRFNTFRWANSELFAKNLAHYKDNGESTYSNAIDSWDTCRSRRARRSLAPLRKIIIIILIFFVVVVLKSENISLHFWKPTFAISCNDLLLQRQCEKVRAGALPYGTLLEDNTVYIEMITAWRADFHTSIRLQNS